MTKISQYPEIANPDVDDLLIGTDVENSNATKNFTIQSIIDLKPTPTLQEVTSSGNTTTTSINANSFVKTNGLSSQILAADGSVIVSGPNITISDGTIYSSGGGGGTGPQGPQGPQGVEGPPGVDGAVGPAGLNWQGAWVSGTSYVADDAVGYGGASWFCILATSGTTDPDLDTTHWALLASQGAQGIQGNQGPEGAQGPAGSVNPVLTSGSIGATESPYPTLTYDLNTVYNSAVLQRVLLPSGAYVGKQVIVYAANNAYTFQVRGADGGPSSAISIVGVQANSLSLTVNPNENYKFTSLGDGYWKAEAVGSSLQQAFNVGKTMTTGNFTAAVFDLKSGLSVKNTSTLDETTVETTKITFTKNQGGLKTTNVFQAVNPTVNRAIYLPDADGTIALTSDVNNRLVSEKSGNYTLADTDSGGIIIFTSNATLTIPTLLSTGFECTFVTLAGATLTVSAGSNVLNNAIGSLLPPQSSFTLKRMIAANTFIATGNL